MARTSACALAAALLLLGVPARAEVAATGAVIDRTVARFYAPETGGSAYPRFVFQRILAFEARLSLMASGQDGAGEGYDDRDLRDALDHHVAEEILASLADRLIADSSRGKRPSAAELALVNAEVVGGLIERAGGRARVDQAAVAEDVDPGEVNAMWSRAGLAAWYLDRAVTPIFHPSEEQLRDVFRASAHPYRGKPFEDVRRPLERWFVIERIRVAESAFLQAARSRVRINMTR